GAVLEVERPGRVGGDGRVRAYAVQAVAAGEAREVIGRAYIGVRAHGGCEGELGDRSGVESALAGCRGRRRRRHDAQARRRARYRRKGDTPPGSVHWFPPMSNSLVAPDDS